jgi:hypothetical protein
VNEVDHNAGWAERSHWWQATRATQSEIDEAVRRVAGAVRRIDEAAA